MAAVDAAVLQPTSLLPNESRRVPTACQRFNTQYIQQARICSTLSCYYALQLLLLLTLSAQTRMYILCSHSLAGSQYLGAFFVHEPNYAVLAVSNYTIFILHFALLCTQTQTHTHTTQYTYEAQTTYINWPVLFHSADQTLYLYYHRYLTTCVPNPDWSIIPCHFEQGFFFAVVVVVVFVLYFYPSKRERFLFECVGAGVVS